MIKQAVLFVASTGLLIYFVMPTGDNNQSTPSVQKSVKLTSDNQENLSNSWEGDEDDGEEDISAFDEPLAYSEGDEEAVDEPYESEEEFSQTPYISDTVTAKTNSANNANAAVYLKAPKPGELGSKENPIDMTPPGGRK